jgi:hypothetical protein
MTQELPKSKKVKSYYPARGVEGEGEGVLGSKQNSQGEPTT